MTKRILKGAICALILILGFLGAASHAFAATKKEMIRDASAALKTLYATTPSSKALADKAAGILVFPGITKGGLLVGGQYGEGVLFKGGKAAGFYNTASVSYGLQAGIQKYGYALFFMDTSDLRYLSKSDGWEIGVGPSITVVDAGVARSLTTTTAREGVYAFFFQQKGLMAGLGLQGTKITPIKPDA